MGSVAEILIADCGHCELCGEALEYCLCDLEVEIADEDLPI